MKTTISSSDGDIISVKSILSFLKECHSEMQYSDRSLDFDEESVYNTIYKYVDSGGCLFVEQTSESITGVFAALIAPNIMNYNQELAIEYIWHTKPTLNKKERIKGMISLIKKGESWANDNQLYLIVGTSASKKGAEKLLTNRGFVAFETSFGKGF